MRKKSTDASAPSAAAGRAQLSLFAPELGGSPPPAGQQTDAPLGDARPSSAPGRTDAWVSVALSPAALHDVAVEVLLIPTRTTLPWPIPCFEAVGRRAGAAVDDALAPRRQAQGGCRVGEVVCTPGGNLAASFLVHVPVPRFRGGHLREAERLRQAYDAALSWVATAGYRRIGIAALGVWAAGFPPDVSARAGVRSWAHAFGGAAAPIETQWLLPDLQMREAFSIALGHEVQSAMVRPGAPAPSPRSI